jgi:hypothetical protein
MSDLMSQIQQTMISSNVVANQTAQTDTVEVTEE